MTEPEVEKLISESIEFGTSVTSGDKIIYVWKPYAFGINEIKTVTTKEGKIITSYPVDGPNVISWID